MYKVVLLRHGQSQWNLENRFTGWHDVDLTEQGQAEARAAGQVLKENGFVFDKAYSSLLKRAIRTLWLALEELDQVWLPVRRDWRLNERHYGALQGLNKAETAEKHGEDQVFADTLIEVLQQQAGRVSLAFERLRAGLLGEALLRKRDAHVVVCLAQREAAGAAHITANGRHSATVGLHQLQLQLLLV